MKKTNAIVAAATLSLATLSAPLAPASAQATSTVQAGMTVYGPEGANVGTVDKSTKAQQRVDTGTHSVALPLDKFGTSGEKGTTISVTKEKLDAIVEKPLPRPPPSSTPRWSKALRWSTTRAWRWARSTRSTARTS